MDRLRCLVIDGHPVVRAGVRYLLDERCELEEAATAGEGLELVRDVGGFDVAIVEMRPSACAPAGSMTSAALIRELLKLSSDLGIVAYGDRAERNLAGEAVRAGATGFIAKGSDARRLSEAVRAAAESKSYLDPAIAAATGDAGVTKRQREILQLLADGNSTSGAAQRLGLSAETVKTHTKHILSRLDAHDRAHAVAIAMRNSLIE